MATHPAVPCAAAPIAAAAAADRPGRQVSLDLEYGVSYPFTVNKHCTMLANSSRASSFPHSTVAGYKDRRVAGIFLNPTRLSVMVFVLADSLYRSYVENDAEDLAETPLQADMVLELSTNHLEGPVKHEAFGDFDSCIQTVMELGISPLPYYRRDGVLLFVRINGVSHDGDDGYGEDADFEKVLAVVVPHTPGVHGCRCRHYETSDDESEQQQQCRPCYFCMHNPFYEVRHALQHWEDDTTVRVSPLEAYSGAVPVGTRLLLRMSSAELQDIIGPDGVSASSGRRHRKGGAVFAQRYDEEGNPLEGGGGVVGRGSSQHGSQRGPRDALAFVVVRLDVPHNIRPVPGKLWVAIDVRPPTSQECPNCRWLYVKVSDLGVCERNRPESTYYSFLVSDTVTAA